MLEVTFSKLHGAANSFIIIRDLAEQIAGRIADQPQIPIDLCSRERGLGADGLVLIQNPTSLNADKTNKADFKLLIYNANNGSLAEMCGNAVRCISKFLHEENLHPSPHVRLETPAGIIESELLVEKMPSKAAQKETRIAYVRVNMGIPRLTSPDFIPPSPNGHTNAKTNDKANAKITNTKMNGTLPEPLPPIDVARDVARFTFAGREAFFVSMGNPHAVIPVTDYNFDYVAYATELQQQKQIFPNGVNVGFVQIPSPSIDKTVSATSYKAQLTEDKQQTRTSGTGIKTGVQNRAEGLTGKLRVVERGVGETSACGTGACAAAVVILLAARTQQQQRQTTTSPSKELVLQQEQKKQQEQKQQSALKTSATSPETSEIERLEASEIGTPEAGIAQTSEAIRIDLEMKGGTLRIDWPASPPSPPQRESQEPPRPNQPNHPNQPNLAAPIFMTGPAETIAKGTLTL